MFDSFDIIERFIPSHVWTKFQDRVVDIFAKMSPDEHWQHFIGAYRSDAEFRESFALALKRALQRCTAQYGNKELGAALLQDTPFWDRPDVHHALREIILRPSSYLESEHHMLFRSFTDMLPGVEGAHLEQFLNAFFSCLVEEVITIPQLAPLYSVQFQKLSLDQGSQMLTTLREFQQEQRQWIMAWQQTLTSSAHLLPAQAQKGVDPGRRTRHNLPPSSGQCLGREKERARVLKGLSCQSLVFIEGLGGMGKTTLALDIAYSCLLGTGTECIPPFDSIVWVSAKDRPEQKLWLNTLLDATARMLDPALIRLPPEQKCLEVDQFLRTCRTLIIMDNLETTNDPALTLWLQHVPPPSNVLVTSRRGHMHNVWTVHLKGLGEAQASELIHHCAQRLELEIIEHASSEMVQPLVQVTGGNPKAIELALGYIKRGRLSLNEVIEHLHAANRTVEGVFQDLFARAWAIMTDDAKYLFVTLPLFADSAKKDALSAVSALSGYRLENAVEELVQLMLLDIHQASLESTQRYSVHPLTRAFAATHLRSLPQFAEQARGRWCKYYRDFAARHLIREHPKEPYWNTLATYNLAHIDQEWPNIQKLLAWADQQEASHLLVDLMLLVVHYMDRCLLYSERFSYAQRAAEAAQGLGQKQVAALLRIDALGWILLEDGRLTDAEREIHMGLDLLQEMESGDSDAHESITLAYAFLARVCLEQGKGAEASAQIQRALDMSMRCKPAVRTRIEIIAGDIAFQHFDDQKAVKHYENAHQISLLYRKPGEDTEVYHRLGMVSLANEDSVEAEKAFTRSLENKPHYTFIESIYLKYGLAGVAKLKGDKDRARQLAQEALSDVLRSLPSHRLLNQIQALLRSLEDDE